MHETPPLYRRKTMCGTPEYAPPEILVRSPAYTKAVDVWSLGVLAFELLTGALVVWACAWLVAIAYAGCCLKLTHGIKA